MLFPNENTTYDVDWTVLLPPRASSWNIINLPLGQDNGLDLGAELIRQSGDLVEHYLAVGQYQGIIYQQILDQKHTRSVWNSSEGYEFTSMEFTVDESGVTYP